MRDVKEVVSSVRAYFEVPNQRKCMSVFLQTRPCVNKRREARCTLPRALCGSRFECQEHAGNTFAWPAATSPNKCDVTETTCALCYWFSHTDSEFQFKFVHKVNGYNIT